MPPELPPAEQLGANSFKCQDENDLTWAPQPNEAARELAESAEVGQVVSTVGSHKFGEAARAALANGEAALAAAKRLQPELNAVRLRERSGAVTPVGPGAKTTKATRFTDSNTGEVSWNRPPELGGSKLTPRAAACCPLSTWPRPCARGVLRAWPRALALEHLLPRPSEARGVGRARVLHGLRVDAMRGRVGRPGRLRLIALARRVLLLRRSRPRPRPTSRATRTTPSSKPPPTSCAGDTLRAAAPRARRARRRRVAPASRTRAALARAPEKAEAAARACSGGCGARASSRARRARARAARVAREREAAVGCRGCCGGARRGRRVRRLRGGPTCCAPRRRRG